MDVNMDTKKETYLVISEATDPRLSFGQAIRATVATATNFRKAYDLALSMGEITNPNLGYRAALERTNGELAFQLEEKDGSKKVTIALIKKY
jgi:hypothetical protein